MPIVDYGMLRGPNGERYVAAEDGSGLTQVGSEAMSGAPPASVVSGEQTPVQTIQPVSGSSYPEALVIEKSVIDWTAMGIMAAVIYLILRRR